VASARRGGGTGRRGAVTDTTVRQVCPLHEPILVICDCDCTCDHSTHVAMGIKGTHHTTECRWPRMVPVGTVKLR
jgi:hypothetical protein